MPTYEYFCQDCGERFDALRLMREADAPIPCEHCGGEHTSRQITACYAQSGGHAVAGSNGGGCAGCGGGSCANCGH